VGSKDDRVDPVQPPPAQLLHWISSHDGPEGGADHRGERIEGDGIAGLCGWDEVGDGTGDVAQGGAVNEKRTSISAREVFAWDEAAYDPTKPEKNLKAATSEKLCARAI
jgi:hypothetical protein